MLRTSLAILALTVSLTLPAMAQDKQAECLKIGQIATDIMAERKSGANDRQAERRVLRNIPNMSKNDEVLAVNLVSWIYSLPEDQLTPEVSNTLYQTCLSQ
ncbi:hypothetical protein GCM10011363_23630 [Marivita lacus]|uniref:DNA primase n=1 Tax=Marivita lacus TaxID=1323742 RepID=A0ABQ1KUS0_9RHOB|nr:hypothetical protein [Marivita lacus]GGC06198.1 hypothetical protein GCM10011363_23630 [Marivita lacus]